LPQSAQSFSSSIGPSAAAGSSSSSGFAAPYDAADPLSPPPGAQAALVAAADEAAAGPFGAYFGRSGSYVLPIGITQMHPLVTFVHPRIAALFEGVTDVIEALVPAEAKRKVGRPRSGVSRLNADCKYFAKLWRRRKLGDMLSERARKARAAAAAAAAASADGQFAQGEQQQQQQAETGSSRGSDREARLAKRLRVSETSE
jgi:hypothetical protein